MGWLDALLGRSKPVKPDLDALFALPSAAVTLQAATGATPTGLGSVCFRAAEGGAFATLEQDISALLGESEVERSQDSYGYTWLLARRPPDDLAALVTDLHGINSSLESAGFGPSLLCSMVTFTMPDGQGSDGRRPDGHGLALVYLYKQGTFYPFAPLPGERRDNALELQVRGAISGDLKIEPDLSRWFPLWGAPGF
ncbi:hypothetical protein [Sphaerisporangium sp. NPDC051011]|uniref:PspA-associated protein PspAB n=1 Tax=Sphaerisporangium sp. NPDC051011 TaxID=3155792 RepID=UPI0033D3035A